MATQVTDPFPNIHPTDDAVLKVSMWDPEKESPHAIALEGLGPETIIGAVKDLVRKGHHKGSKITAIVIELPDPDR
jgi:hypothetical protein